MKASTAPQRRRTNHRSLSNGLLAQAGRRERFHSRPRPLYTEPPQQPWSRPKAATVGNISFIIDSRPGAKLLIFCGSWCRLCCLGRRWLRRDGIDLTAKPMVHGGSDQRADAVFVAVLPIVSEICPTLLRLATVNIVQHDLQYVPFGFGNRAVFGRLALVRTFGADSLNEGQCILGDIRLCAIDLGFVFRPEGVAGHRVDAIS